MEKIMKNKGFTLIELLVVVLIIGILAGVALPQYTKAVEKSRATEAITLLSNIAKAETVYALGTNSYTKDLNSLDIQMPNVSGTDTVKNISTNKNFTITVLTGDAGSFQAAAVRRSGTVYSIVATMTPTSTLQMRCVAQGVTNSIPAITTLGSTEAGKICKSIANGNTQGIIMQ